MKQSPVKFIDEIESIPSQCLYCATTKTRARLSAATQRCELFGCEMTFWLNFNSTFLLSNMETIGLFIKEISTNATSTLETWPDALFKGEEDKSGKTVM